MFSDEQYHLGIVLLKAWKNTVYCAMEAYKELFRHKRNEEKQHEMITSFQRIWIASNTFGRKGNSGIKWHVTPHPKLLETLEHGPLLQFESSDHLHPQTSKPNSRPEWISRHWSKHSYKISRTTLNNTPPNQTNPDAERPEETPSTSTQAGGTPQHPPHLESNYPPPVRQTATEEQVPSEETAHYSTPLQGETDTRAECSERTQT